MFNNLPKQSEANQFKTGDNKREFEAMPSEFTHQQAVEIGKHLQLSSRTVNDILHNATDKALEKLKAGLYRKNLPSSFPRHSSQYGIPDEVFALFADF